MHLQYPNWLLPEVKDKIKKKKERKTTYLFRKPIIYIFCNITCDTVLFHLSRLFYNNACAGVSNTSRTTLNKYFHTREFALDTIFFAQADFILKESSSEPLDPLAKAI
jgi:hypothetical protein